MFSKAISNDNTSVVMHTNTGLVIPVVALCAADLTGEKQQKYRNNEVVLATEMARIFVATTGESVKKRFNLPAATAEEIKAAKELQHKRHALVDLIVDVLSGKIDTSAAQLTQLDLPNPYAFSYHSTFRHRPQYSNFPAHKSDGTSACGEGFYPLYIVSSQKDDGSYAEMGHLFINEAAETAFGLDGLNAKLNQIPAVLNAAHFVQTRNLISRAMSTKWQP